MCQIESVPNYRPGKEVAVATVYAESLIWEEIVAFFLYF